MVEIVEVSPRDGLQNEHLVLPTQAKVELIADAVAAGARRIEAVSFARPDAVPAMADAEAVLAAVTRVPGVRLAGLVLNRRGLDRALAAGVDEVNVVVPVTDTFGRRNQNAATEDLMTVAQDVAGRAASAGVFCTVTLAVAFGCPFEGEVDPARVLALGRRAAAAGAREVALADTVGVAVPRQVTALVEGLRAVVAGENPARPPRVRVHLHNTRNTGYANAVAALTADVDALDASIGGVGGCPFAPRAGGNIATEDLVYLLERSGIPSGFDLERLLVAARRLGERLGHDVPSMLTRAGTFPPPPSTSTATAP